MSTADDLQQTVDHVQSSSKAVRHGRPRPFYGVLVAYRRRHHLWWLGAYERGWEQIGPRLEWAAARYRGGQTDFDPLALGMSGDLAYSVWIERGEARVVGQDEFSPIALRVTHIYRREDGSWKIIHRHADAIIEKIEATVVLQR
jgi:hypothetical protein